MAKNYGIEFPERPLMATLSDLLGIPHFTTSRGSTVRKDFLEAVCMALGVEDERIRKADKDGVLRLAVEAATDQRMPNSLLSRGATVTNDALQAIIVGVTKKIEQGTVVDFGRFQREDSTEVPDELLVSVDRIRRLREEAVRQGQSGFRRRLVEAYKGCCCITGANAVQVLDAAHIIPVSSKGSDTTKNGLLLRTDLHRLFDAGALGVDDQYRVILSPHLVPTSYGHLSGVRLQLPKLVADQPSREALRSHRVAARLE
jgi:hypothetical protein